MRAESFRNRYAIRWSRNPGADRNRRPITFSGRFMNMSLIRDIAYLDRRHMHTTLDGRIRNVACLIVRARDWNRFVFVQTRGGGRIAAESRSDDGAFRDYAAIQV